MKICPWCGIQLIGFRRLFRYCQICAEAMAWDYASPPCSYMFHFPAREEIARRYR